MQLQTCSFTLKPSSGANKYQVQILSNPPAQLLLITYFLAALLFCVLNITGSVDVFFSLVELMLW